MTDQLVRAIVALLQQQPLYYRHFGYYWWYIKGELKRTGVEKSELPTLGDYTDPQCEDWYKTQRRSTLLEEALDQQEMSATLHYYNNTSAVPVSAGGGVYVVYDGDVE